ncbi:TPA: ATP-dependent endonuclease, partial [Escherichia coli]|nr:ATP-dependent endonuclease [Escherichia coli]
FQIPVLAAFKGVNQEFLPNTFEDSLVYNNLDFFSNLTGNGLVKKFKASITNCKNAEEFGEESFLHLSKGNKAEFALDILYHDESDKLNTPNYISNGLKWLEEKIKIKQLELVSDLASDGENK